MNTTSVTTIWGFFDHVGPLQIMLMLIVITVILMIFILITRPTLKLGSNSISFGKKQIDDDSDKQLPPHASCPYNIDFYHVVTKTVEIVTKICYIDNVDLVAKQMLYFEEKVATVKSMLLDNYSKMLKNKLKDSTSITAHEDYITYHRLVESMLREDVKIFIKRSLTEEQFEDLTDTEFKVFVNEKFEYVYQLASEFMDIWYISNKMLIAREEVRQTVISLRPKFLDICFDVYSKAIRLKQDHRKIKNTLNQELDSFYEKIVGTVNETRTIKIN